MRTLKILIKLHKKQIDDLIIKINNLDKQKDDLEQDLKNLQAEVKLAIAEFASSDYAYMLNKFLESSQDKKKNITMQKNNLSSQIDNLRIELQDQFSEIKKYEIALENRLQEQKNALKKYETKILDEFNTNKFANTNK